MKIYAIGDLHLSGKPPSKPMEIFGKHWADHAAKVAAGAKSFCAATMTTGGHL